MEQCTNCGHVKLVKKGKIFRSKVEHQRLYCTNCNTNLYIPLDAVNTVSAEDEFTDILSKAAYVRDDVWVSKKLKAKKFVITSAQSNTKLDDNFLGSLKTYCRLNKAELLVIPVKYRNPTSPTEFDVVEHDYDTRIKEYLFENNIKLHPRLKVLGSLKIAATAEYPLTGLTPLSKGDSVIIGHGQLQMTTVPVQQSDYPVIMTTTGSLSDRNYSISKQGYKAEFNHSLSAVVVELDNDLFHIRHLNFDGVGFADLETYYDSQSSKTVQIAAIVTGDEHVIFADKDVSKVTYGKKGIVDILKPSFIVRHDVLDCYAISHHHRRDTLTKFKKHVTGQDNIAEELIQTVSYIVDTTPEYAVNILVPSNHTDHLTKWMNECDIKQEPWNALIYHQLMYHSLKAISDDPESYPNPFKIFSNEAFEESKCSVEFLSRRESYKIHDIEIAIHGDIGTNGSKGTRDTFAKLPSKTIVGHSHSPGIEKGCYQTGTSSKLALEYNVGPSSWLHTHCIIHKNGKRQLINIIDGKWRAK